MKEHKFFIDTNIFLRVIVQDEAKQAMDCVSVLRKLREGKFVAFTSALVLAEIQWTLTKFYNFEKKDTLRALEGISAIKNLKFVEETNFSLALFLYGHNPIKFIDCLIASYTPILHKHLPILSYDKEFDKIEVKRLEPKDLL